MDDFATLVLPKRCADDEIRLTATRDMTADRISPWETGKSAYRLTLSVADHDLDLGHIHVVEVGTDHPAIRALAHVFPFIRAFIEGDSEIFDLSEFPQFARESLSSWLEMLDQEFSWFWSGRWVFRTTQSEFIAGVVNLAIRYGFAPMLGTWDRETLADALEWMNEFARESEADGKFFIAGTSLYFGTGE